jgi:hypothetical protein
MLMWDKQIVKRLACLEEEKRIRVLRNCNREADVAVDSAGLRVG